jgi:cytidine deaminase
MDSPDPLEELITLAREARKQAYAPYSRFAVGAALRTVSGHVYTGCNVENASYGLSICAERVAVGKAVSEGDRNFETLAVVSETMASPCGACRQVLAEFGLDTRVVIADLEHGREIRTVRDLLPAAFTPACLPKASLDDEKDSS